MSAVMTKKTSAEDFNAPERVDQPPFRNLDKTLRRLKNIIDASASSYDSKEDDRDYTTRTTYEKEHKKRKRLDNSQCILLGTGNPKLYHIVPWNTNSKETQRARIHKYFPAVITLLFPRNCARGSTAYDQPRRS